MNLGWHQESRTRPKMARSMAGFTLLEVLVAVVVLSFGVLGVVGLQAAALQSNKDARFQSSAARLAREMADMMRDNPTVVSSYLGTYTSALPDPSSNCYSSTTACAGTAGAVPLAQFELADWTQRLLDEVPGAQAVICYDSTPYTSGVANWGCTSATGSLLYIKIRWPRQGFNASGTAPALGMPGIVQALIPG